MCGPPEGPRDDVNSGKGRFKVKHINPHLVVLVCEHKHVGLYVCGDVASCVPVRLCMRL